MSMDNQESEFNNIDKLNISQRKNIEIKTLPLNLQDIDRNSNGFSKLSDRNEGNNHMNSSTSLNSYRQSKNLISKYNNLRRIFIDKQENENIVKKSTSSEIKFDNSLRNSNNEYENELLTKTKSTFSRGGNLIINQNLKDQNVDNLFESKFNLSPTKSKSQKNVNFANFSPLNPIDNSIQENYQEKSDISHILYYNSKKPKEKKNKFQSLVQIRDKSKINLSENYYIQTIRFSFNYYFKVLTTTKTYHQLNKINFPSPKFKNSNESIITNKTQFLDFFKKNDQINELRESRNKRALQNKSRSLEKLDLDPKIFGYLFLMKFLGGKYSEKIKFFNQKGEEIPFEIQSIISFCIGKSFSSIVDENNVKNCQSFIIENNETKKESKENLNDKKIYYEVDPTKKLETNFQDNEKPLIILREVINETPENQEDIQQRESMIQSKMNDLLNTLRSEVDQNNVIDFKPKLNLSNIKNGKNPQTGRNFEFHKKSDSMRKKEDDFQQFFEKNENSTFTDRYELTTKTHFSSTKLTNIKNTQIKNLNLSQLKIKNEDKGFLSSRLNDKRNQNIFNSNDSTLQTQNKLKRLLEESNQKSKDMNAKFERDKIQTNKKRTLLLHSNRWIYPPNSVNGGGDCDFFASK